VPYVTDARVLAAVRARNRHSQREDARPQATAAFPLLKQPDLQRAAYFKRLRTEYLAAMEKLVQRKLVPILQEVAEDYRRQQEAEARGDAWRTDARRPEDVRNVFQDMARQFLEDMPNAKVAEMARTTAWETSAFHRAELRTAFRKHLSVDVDELFREEPGLRRAVDDFTVENVALIRSVSSRHFAEVEELVLEAVSKGMRPEKLAKLIEERTGVAESSAARIARDQVGKFHGKLNESRQKALGVKRYRWRTMRDNRVRSQHQERNGDVFSWADPPADGHPGQPINCRCWAEPVLDDVLAEELVQKTSGETPEEGSGWQRLGRKKPPGSRAPRPRATPRAPTTPTAPMPSNGPVRGDGAAVASRHPELAAVLGDKLRVDDFQSFDVKEQVRDLASLPQALLEQVAGKVGDIHIGNAPITQMGRSGTMAAHAANRPPGYDEGDTYETTGGVFIGGVNEVLVSVPNGRPETALHEFGHAVSALTRNGVLASTTPEFRDAYADFVSGGYEASDRPFYLQSGDIGPEEAFAEAFAQFYKWGDSVAERKFGPKVVAYIRDNFGPDAWPRKRTRR
jgi:SPP1 gp7 family putative phage head morphogenesis protein